MEITTNLLIDISKCLDRAKADLNIFSKEYKDIERVEKSIAELNKSFSGVQNFSKKGLIKRNEDMSPEGRLVLCQEEDGDIIVSIHGRDDLDEYSHSKVEFCNPFMGGGRSPHTRKALLDLMEAIEKDNEENPIC